jgi:hypothetical protein
MELDHPGGFRSEFLSGTDIAATGQAAHHKRSAPRQPEDNMSYPYPQDRHRDRKEKGEQPYKDDRETLAENEAELRNQARDDWPPDEDEGEEDRAERLRLEAQDRLESVQQKIDKQ